MGSEWSRRQATIDDLYNKDPNDVQSWDVSHVKALHKAYKSGGYDFGLEKESLKSLLGEALPKSKDILPLLWRQYVYVGEDATGTGGPGPASPPGVLYALEMFVGMAVLCKGMTKDKARLLFEIFDFNNTGNLTYDDLVVAISTFAGAMHLALGPEKALLLDEESIDKLADDAYVSLELDSSANVSLDQWLEWLGGAKGMQLEVDKTVELPVMLKRFKMTGASAATSSETETEN